MVAKLKKSKSKTKISKPAKKVAKAKKPVSKVAKKTSTKIKHTSKATKNKPERAKLKVKIASKSTKSKDSNKTKSKSPTLRNVKTKKHFKDEKPVSTNKLKLVKKSVTQSDNKFNETDLANLNTSYLTGPGKFQPYEIDNSEEYMNEQQLEHFSNILEAWKQELMLEVDHTITEMKEADILADPNDRATQEETFNLELRARDRERKLIKKIEAALNKISEQKYGYCDSCGVEIGVRRLEARPTATLCIECKTLDEIREKRS